MSAHPIIESADLFNRRALLRGTMGGLGAAAFGSMLAGEAVAGDGPLLSATHFPARAKRVIYLHMSGAPSQIDTFDYKPELERYYDTELPESIRKGQRLTTMTSGQARFPIAPSKYSFARHGQSGCWVSELLPHTASMVDDLAVIRSLYTEAINHDPAMTFCQTGHEQPGRPSIGAWISYGLGSANEDLPTFMVMTPTWTGRKEAQALFSRLWSTGFLPTEHQGVALRAKGDPVLYLSNPAGLDRASRRRQLDAIEQLNARRAAETGDPEVLARMAQYEMSFRMQASVPELIDTMSEPDHVRALYGADVDTPGTFANCTLLARRMVERGVRFVQLYHRGWDQHANLTGDLPNQCRDIDQACAGLIADLKQRGMFEDTLIVWATEFGRTVYCQGGLTRENYGRDHHPRCFTVWLAGGGVKGGVQIGQTDEFSYNIVEDPIHIHDLNATILHLMGIDHERLTHRFRGRDYRLTDVEGHVVKGILA
jgi:hypothetical protein